MEGWRIEDRKDRRLLRLSILYLLSTILSSTPLRDAIDGIVGGAISERRFP
jgi:hypothetical protein